MKLVGNSEYSKIDSFKMLFSTGANSQSSLKEIHVLNFLNIKELNKKLVQ